MGQADEDKDGNLSSEEKSKAEKVLRDAYKRLKDARGNMKPKRTG